MNTLTLPPSTSELGLLPTAIYRVLVTGARTLEEARSEHQALELETGKHFRPALTVRTDDHGYVVVQLLSSRRR